MTQFKEERPGVFVEEGTDPPKGLLDYMAKGDEVERIYIRRSETLRRMKCEHEPDHFLTIWPISEYPDVFDNLDYVSYEGGEWGIK